MTRRVCAEWRGKARPFVIDSGRWCLFVKMRRGLMAEGGEADKRHTGETRAAGKLPAPVQSSGEAPQWNVSAVKVSWSWITSWISLMTPGTSG
jgi:hypothetical protein